MRAPTCATSLLSLTTFSQRKLLPTSGDTIHSRNTGCECPCPSSLRELTSRFLIVPRVRLRPLYISTQNNTWRIPHLEDLIQALASHNTRSPESAKDPFRIMIVGEPSRNELCESQPCFPSHTPLRSLSARITAHISPIFFICENEPALHLPRSNISQPVIGMLSKLCFATG